MNLSCYKIISLQIAKLTFFATLVILFSSCASLPIDSLSVIKEPIVENISTIDGTYSIDFNNYGEINRIIEIINRNTDDWPELLHDEKYFVKLETSEDNNQIKIELLSSNGHIIETQVRVKKVKENYIYLSNRNVKLHNIPFILGGYEYQKTRLCKDKDGNLIVDSVSYGIGSLLFVIWSGSRVSKHNCTYDLIID